MNLDEYRKILGGVVGKQNVLVGNNYNFERIKLTSPSMNYLFGGGIPRGVILQLMGLEQTTKSLMALSIAADIQRQTNKAVCYIEAAEVGYTTEHAANLGLDTEKTILVRANTAEQALTSIKKVLGENKDSSPFCCVILDSVGGLVPEKLSDEDKDIGEVSAMGTRARLLSEALPIFSVKCVANDVVLILINQMRSINLSGYGNPEGGMGGKAMAYYSSIIARLSKPSVKAEDSSGITGFDVHVVLTKTKYGKANRSIDLQVVLEEDEEGRVKTYYDPIIDVIKMGKKLGLIQVNGSFYSFTLSTGELIKVQGEKNLKAHLLANPAVLDELRDLINVRI
jgi:RecA/RadA recombinase